MLRYGLGHPVEYALEVVQLAGVLHLHDDNLPLGVGGLDVHSVELVVLCLLVALALEYLHDFHLLADEHGEESLQHVEVGLLAEQPLYGPVEAYVPVLHNLRVWMSVDETVYVQS